jgi:hypothetical protein
MRPMLAVVAALCSTAAFAQTPAPTYGGKPLLHVGRPAASKLAGTPKPKAPAKPQSVAVKLQECLDLDDGTKGRLDCYDAIFAPKPNPRAPEAKSVADCRFKKEQDERLACFNDFAERIPKLPRS